MKKIITLLAVFAIVIAKAQPCPTFSIASPTNFSISCPPGNTTISIVNPVSTQTPPATVSYTFLPPGFSGAISPSVILGNNTTTIATVAGTWSVLVRDNSNFCTTTQTVMITGGPPYFTIAASLTGSCNGTATINPQGNTGYSVSASQGTVSGNSISGLCAGYLQVCLTNTITTCKYCDSLIISTTTGLKENDNNKIISIYPNPSQGSFNVALSSTDKNVKMQVINVLGKLVFERSYVSDEKIFQARIDMQDEPSGIYFIRISDGKNEYAKKVMISR
jgi:hypothetical protein